MKLAIGTANFQNKYGLLGTSIVGKKKITEIKKELKKNNISFLDTPFEYNNLDIRFFPKKNNLKIITKIKLPKLERKKFINNLHNMVESELKRIKKKNFEAILLHNSKDLNSTIGINFLKEVKKLKKNKLTKKIGVSIYNPIELKKIFSRFTPDIIQAPLNVFDKRILFSKFLKNKKKKIILQVRSIFLQGLLLQNIKKIKNLKLNRKLKSKLVEFDDLCKKNKSIKLEQSINFILNQQKVDIITFGVDSSKNLKKNLMILKKKKIQNTIDISTTDNRIIDPRKW